MDAPSGTAAGSSLHPARLSLHSSVLAAAPKDFADRITRTWYGPRGLVLELRDGPALVFGTATEAARKWAAAVAVLLNPAAAGALYLDLRVPGSPRYRRRPRPRSPP